MEIGKYLILILINLTISLYSCNDEKRTIVFMLEDISSNCYYIPISIKYNGMIYEIVIPNERLYSILSQEYGEDFTMELYINMLLPVLQEQEPFLVQKTTFKKITPYILPEDWNEQVFKIQDLFYNNIQSAKINHELVLIRQLFDLGYVVYIDDETGLLVRKEY